MTNCSVSNGEPNVRRWKAWVILEPDETFYRVSHDDPRTVPSLIKLLAIGWFAIPVEIVETAE